MNSLDDIRQQDVTNCERGGEVITEEGKPKKQVTKKRIIKKKAGKKEQVTEIVTVQEDDQLPQTTVTVTESELPFEEVIELKPSRVEPQEAIIQELPEEVKVTEVITEEGLNSVTSSNGSSDSVMVTVV